MADGIKLRHPATGQRLEVAPTLMDRAVSWFSPEAGARRFRARVQLALLGGYGTHKKRRQIKDWNPSQGDADADLLPDLPDLREEARDLERRMPLAGGAIRTKVTNVVGAELRMQSAVDREFLGLSDDEADEIESGFEREWGIFANTVECDLERERTFGQLVRVAYGSRLSSGDCVVLTPFLERAGSPYGLKLQLIEGDRLSNPDWEADSEQIAGGVERDPATGARLAYHIANRHPGGLSRYGQSLKWSRYEAFSPTGRPNVLHVYDPRRPGQSRGVPDLAPVIETLKQTGRYIDAEIASAVISSYFTVFIKSETSGTGGPLAPMSPTGEIGGSDSDTDYKLGHGAILDLGINETVEFADPKRPNQAFEPFMLSIIRFIGVALELPFEILIKHFTSSYSASRGAIVEAFKYFVAERRLLAQQLCQPVYELAMTEAIARGRVSAPGFMAGDIAVRRAYLGAVWIGPGRGQINEKVEAEAAVVRIQNNLSTLAKETATIDGSDWQANVRQRRREKAVETAAGVEPPTKATPAPPGNALADDPDLADALERQVS